MIYDGVIAKPSLEEVFAHSGIKGMEWKEHKYIKKLNGTYYYPEGSNAAKVSEYKDGDSDFDEKNYSEKNRLGNTDFFAFTRPDGKVVIIEEDMKWELPDGQKIDDNLIKRLEGIGGTNTNDEFVNKATTAISGGSNGKLSSKDVSNLANEVVKGNFGNGSKRKELLGDDYQEVQNEVNKILKGSSSKTKSESTSKKEKSSTKDDYEVKEGNGHYKYKVKKKS